MTARGGISATLVKTDPVASFAEVEVVRATSIKG